MKSTTACAAAIVVLLAVMATAEAANCHTSAYTLGCPAVQAAKDQLLAKCGAEVPGGISVEGGYTTEGACCTMVQKTADKAGWDSFQQCQESAANAAVFGPLKAARCSSQRKDEAC